MNKKKCEEVRKSILISYLKNSYWKWLVVLFFSVVAHIIYMTLTFSLVPLIQEGIFRWTLVFAWIFIIVTLLLFTLKIGDWGLMFSGLMLVIMSLSTFNDPILRAVSEIALMYSFIFLFIKMAGIEFDIKLKVRERPWSFQKTQSSGGTK